MRSGSIAVRTLAILGLGLCLNDPWPAQAAAAESTESQREAAAVLDAMTRYLAGLEAFSVEFRDGYDAVQASGQKIEFGERRKIQLERPDRLRVDDRTSGGEHDTAVFDGQTISVFDADRDVYAQAPQPGNVDEALVYYVRGLKMRMPLALLLSAKLPDSLPGRVKAIDYVEESEITGARTHHIAGRTDNVDFQFWVLQGARPLPMRVVITYVHSPGQPQFWADFSDWNTSPGFAPGTFEFKPPAGASKVPFAIQVRDATAVAGANP